MSIRENFLHRLISDEDNHKFLTFGLGCVKNSAMTQTHDDVPVTVFSGMLWEAELVKAMLLNAEIYAFLSDKIFGGVLPPIYSATDTGQVKVKVSNRDAKRAQAIVAEFEKNRETE